MIRYDKTLSLEIKRTINNFNAKIRRLERAEAEVIPDKLSITELKEEFTDRRQLRSFLRNVRRFSERSAAEVVEGAGAKFTNWQYQTLKRQIAVTKGRITRELKSIDLQSAKYKSLRIERIKNLEAKYQLLSQDVLEVGRDEIQTIKRIISDTKPDRERDKRFYNSFFGWIYELSNIGIDRSKVEKITSKLSQLTPDQLSEAYRYEPILQDMREIYLNYKKGLMNWDDAMDKVNTLEQESSRIVEEYGKA